MQRFYAGSDFGRNRNYHLWVKNIHFLVISTKIYEECICFVDGTSEACVSPPKVAKECVDNSPVPSCLQSCLQKSGRQSWLRRQTRFIIGFSSRRGTCSGRGENFQRWRQGVMCFAQVAGCVAGCAAEKRIDRTTRGVYSQYKAK